MYLIYAFIINLVLFNTCVNSSQEYSVPIGLKCNNSEQCNKFDENSLCFASDNQFKEWVCLCKHDFYYDKNFTQKCLKKFDFGIKCNTSDQCLGENSICDHKYRCNCPQNHYLDYISNECKNNESLKCSETEEWNQFINKCQTKVHYSHKGGGGKGRVRAGIRYSTVRGGRSWWYTSWFATRGSGGYRGGHNITDKESFAWEKLFFVITAICFVSLVFCYCFSIRKTGKRNTKGRNVPKKPYQKIVTEGTDDLYPPLINNPTQPDLWINIGLPIDPNSVSTSSFDNILNKTSCEGLQSSPPPPYTPKNSSPILTFISESTPESRPQSISHSSSTHASYYSVQSLTLSSDTKQNTTQTTARSTSAPNLILN